jgi:hypothetical protein
MTPQYHIDGACRVMRSIKSRQRRVRVKLDRAVAPRWIVDTPLLHRFEVNVVSLGHVYPIFPRLESFLDLVRYRHCIPELTKHKRSVQVCTTLE